MPKQELSDCVEYGVCPGELAQFKIEGVYVEDGNSDSFGRPIYYVKGEIAPAGIVTGRSNVQLVVTFFDSSDRVVAHAIEEVVIDDLAIPEAFSVFTQSCCTSISLIRLMLR